MGGGEYTRPQLYGANTPSRKKIKKFQKRKNQKNKIQNTQIFEIAFILLSNLRCIAFLCIEWLVVSLSIRTCVRREIWEYLYFG